MRRVVTLSLAVCALLTILPAVAQGPDEEVEVRLILIDTLVTDEDGKTVPGLAKSDFTAALEERPVPIDTLDEFCPDGALAEPADLVRHEARPQAPDHKRKVVFVIDYYHLGLLDPARAGGSPRASQRTLALQSVKSMLQSNKTDQEEVMIVALAKGVRIEQRFTKDVDQATRVLQRMEYDHTLWPKDFSADARKGFYKDMATLMDVLAAYDGSKAVVVISAWWMEPAKLTGAKMVPAELRAKHDDVVQRAAVGQTVIYPAFVTGDAPKPRHSNAGVGKLAGNPLQWLAKDTGGYLPSLKKTTDVGVAYARAQRDLSCRYTLGFYVDKKLSTENVRDVHITVKPDDLTVAFPDRFKLWSEDDQRSSRQSAAFADPRKFDSPLVRSSVFPVRLDSTKSWHTLIAVHFPMPVEAGGAELEVAATVYRGVTKLGDYSEQFTVEPPQDGSASRPVTVLGDVNLKPGKHKLVVVLSRPNGEEVVSAHDEFYVPGIPEGFLALRGPVLARVLKDGVLIDVDRDEDAENPNKAVLRDILGEEGSFEPLLVNQLDVGDEMLMLWEACIAGKGGPDAPAIVDRRLVNTDGKVVGRLDPVPLKLAGNKKFRCFGKLDTFKVKDLDPGEYRVEVSIEDEKTQEAITTGSTQVFVE